MISKMNKILQGDCLETLKTLPENLIDAIVTDPPYELGFMGKAWDNTGIANNHLMWKECLRVLKPGGYLLSFGGTRTYHRMAVAIEDAGFEVRDMIEWVYGSGFPKSLNIGKVTDKFLKTGNASWNGTGDSSNGALGYSKLQHKQDYRPEDYSNRHQNKDEITEEQAKQWEGWGTALKPAHEPICMARKPLAEKTVAENVLKYGTGGINIDESRVDTITEADKNNFHQNRKVVKEYKADDTLYELGIKTVSTEENPLGRFPANLIHDNSEEVRECFPDSKSTGGSGEASKNYKSDGRTVSGSCQATGGFGDSGNASRFFKSIIYQAKASKSERNKGCEELEVKQTQGGGGGIGDYQDDVNSMSGKYGSEKAPAQNNHPTVKPIALMEYLITMVSREGATILDPFSGSGSTLVAAKKLKRNYVGCELDPEYIKIAEARLAGVEESTLF